MPIRSIILVDERDNAIGTSTVPDNTRLIQHKDRLFIRADKVRRLTGGGVGAVFEEVEPIVRDKLSEGVRRG